MGLWYPIGEVYRIGSIELGVEDNSIIPASLYFCERRNGLVRQGCLGDFG